MLPVSDVSVSQGVDREGCSGYEITVGRWPSSRVDDSMLERWKAAMTRYFRIIWSHRKESSHVFSSIGLCYKRMNKVVMFYYQAGRYVWWYSFPRQARP